jgi:hypothetical protein
MKKHKVIPVAVLACLCALALVMNNEQCNAEDTKPATSSMNAGNAASKEKTVKKEKNKEKKGKKRNRRNRNKKENTDKKKKGKCTTGSCKK